jgi:hypothetical protein
MSPSVPLDKVSIKETIDDEKSSFESQADSAPAFTMPEGSDSLRFAEQESNRTLFSENVSGLNVRPIVGFDGQLIGELELKPNGNNQITFPDGATALLDESGKVIGGDASSSEVSLARTALRREHHLSALSEDVGEKEANRIVDENFAAIQSNGGDIEVSNAESSQEKQPIQYKEWATPPEGYVTPEDLELATKSSSQNGETPEQQEENRLDQPWSEVPEVGKDSKPSKPEEIIVTDTEEKPSSEKPGVSTNSQSENTEEEPAGIIVPDTGQKPSADENEVSKPSSTRALDITEKVQKLYVEGGEKLEDKLPSASFKVAQEFTKEYTDQELAQVFESGRATGDFKRELAPILEKYGDFPVSTEEKIGGAIISEIPIVGGLIKDEVIKTVPVKEKAYEQAGHYVDLLKEAAGDSK